MTTELERALQQGIARTVAVVGLAGVALIHLLDLPGQFQETQYASLSVEGSLVALACAMLTSFSAVRRRVRLPIVSVRAGA